MGQDGDARARGRRSPDRSKVGKLFTKWHEDAGSLIGPDKAKRMPVDLADAGAIFRLTMDLGDQLKAKDCR
jgi:hypothetical protein